MAVVRPAPKGERGNSSSRRTNWRATACLRWTTRSGALWALPAAALLRPGRAHGATDVRRRAYGNPIRILQQRPENVADGPKVLVAARQSNGYDRHAARLEHLRHEFLFVEGAIPRDDHGIEAFRERDDFVIGRSRRQMLAHVLNVESHDAEGVRQDKRQVLVEQEPHAARRPSAFSKPTAACISADVRSG